MTEALGNYGLMAAVLAAAGAVVAAVAAGRSGSDRSLRLARWLLALIVVLFSICAAALAHAILTDRFDLEYVAHYSERALPVGYKIAAFWAGQAGSLLLWGWLVAVAGLVAALSIRRWDAARQAGTLATLAVVAGFFAVLMLFVSDASPFNPTLAKHPDTHEMVRYTPPDGRGLNPMLQDPAMMAHPPTLFVGYAGFTVPFALMVGALVAGRLDNRWLRHVRLWILGSWVFLGIGILLGSWWAYVELGWGGYWAWDPVENASLLPWLTATALLHTLVVQRSRGLLKGVNAALVAATFLLCLFGTYLTRSGIVQSVHSFGESRMGVVLLAFLTALTAASVALLLWRRTALRPTREAAPWGWRTWTLCAVAALLVLMAAFTVMGTLAPVVTGAVSDARVAVEEPFYNRYVLQLCGLPLMALLVVAPLASFSRKAAISLKAGFVTALVAGLVGAGVALAAGLRDAVALLTAGVVLGAVTVMAVDLAASVVARRRATGEHPVLAAVRRVTGSRRLYGAQVSHLGVVLILLGVVGSSLFATKETIRLAVDQAAQVGRYVLTLRGVRDIHPANYGATEAIVDVTHPDGRAITLRPQQRRYDRSPDMTNHEIALTMTPKEDLYVILAGGDEKGEFVFLKVLVKPLLLWIWIGGIILTVGGLLPRALPAVRVASTETAAEPRARPPARRAAIESET